jgi:hypothetical protein
MIRWEDKLVVKKPSLLSTYVLLSLEIQKISNYIQLNQIWILTKVGFKIILPVAAFG